MKRPILLLIVLAISFGSFHLRSPSAGTCFRAHHLGLEPHVEPLPPPHGQDEDLLG